MSEALLAKLIEAGTPAALVAEVAMQLARAEAVQQAMEQRRAKDRERKRLRNSTESEESAEFQETPSPFAPPKNTPTPPKITPPISPIPPKTRGSRLPDDWQPLPLAGKALEMVHRWRPGDLERELAKFKNYWMGKAGKDACKTDWQRTWINWLISADERKPSNDRHPPSDSLSSTTRAAIAVFGPLGPG